MNGKGKKLFGILLAWALVVASLTSNLPGTNVAAATVTTPASAVEAGLQTDVQDGVTLQCWNWSYDNITANMEKIAGLGYSAIQTSPIQQAKESTTGKSVGTSWWLYYQPATFAIDNTGNSALGNKQDFIDMCNAAHSCGVKVIVDVIANHMGNQTGNDLAPNITPDIRNDSSCWHNIRINISDYSSRYNITQYCMSGLPDLNTSSKKIQNYVLSYLKECIDAGADGFRFDAAKHIETPDDSASGCGSDFWPTVINGATSYAQTSKGIDLYCYGEVLDQPDTKGTLQVSSYTKYMSVTDNQAGNNLRNYVNGGNASAAGTSSYCKSTTADNLVLWAESHDTYANNESSGVSTNNIDKTWALVAARANAMGLYFARPNGTSTTLGTADTTGWSYSEVGAANRFHNAFEGQSEYMASEGSVAYCERGTSGVVLVNCNGGSSSVNVTAHKMTSGTYKDQISGNTFTVSNGRISGTIGDKGFAVVYNINQNPTITVSKESGTFSGDTMSLTVTLNNATSGTYQVGTNSAVSFTGSTTVTIGSDMGAGNSVTVKLSATSGTTTVYKECTYQKTAVTSNIAYINKPSGWGSNLYCYVYSADNSSNCNAAWPGVAMTNVSGSIYKYEVSSTITNPLVIFTDGSNQYPASQQKGLTLSGSMIYQNGSWTTYNEVVTTNVAYIAKDSTWGSTMYCYAYSSDNESNRNAAWPGVAMTLASGNIYKYEVPSGIANPKVIFTDGTNQYPGAMQSGLLLTGSMIYQNSTWSTYTP